MELDEMTTGIFVGVNRRDRLHQGLLSRFVTFDFKPYSLEGFLEVAREVSLASWARTRTWHAK